MRKMTKSAKILRLTQEVADAMPGTFRKKGPGKGNKFTNAYMAELNRRVEDQFGAECVEQKICGDTKQSVDFYLRDEKTVIEVELSLYNVHTNLDRDIFKILLAKDTGADISRLVLLGKESAKERHKQPASCALIEWVRKHHKLEVRIEDIRKKS